MGRGEIVTIVGPNGAGKSTLIKAVIGLLRPWAGRILLRGEDLTGRKPHAIVAQGVGYVAQRQNVFPTMTVAENLELGGLALREGTVASSQAETLELFPRLQERRRQLAGTLSGGERQMLAMARALMARPDVLLLDEPSAGLAPMAVDAIFERIASINAAGVAILMVEQNARRALAMSHRGYVLDTGRNRFEGPGLELLANPEVVDLYLGGGGRLDTDLVVEQEEPSADPRLEAEHVRQLGRANVVGHAHDHVEVVDVVEGVDRVRQRQRLAGREEVVVERSDESRPVRGGAIQEACEQVERASSILVRCRVPAACRRREDEDAVRGLEGRSCVLHGRASL